MVSNYLGIDIGGTKCVVCLGTERGEVIDRLVYPTCKHGDGWKKTVGDLESGAEDLIRRHAVRELAGVGISCGSPMHRSQGVIQEPANLPGWRDVPIVGLFKEHFPETPVWLENDANAGALAERAFGAGSDSDCRHMAFLTFGTGLGAGLILDGRLHRGANDYAGEIGHLRLEPWGPAGCGKPGSFEGFCSGGGIEQVAEIERRAWFEPTILPEDGLSAVDVGLGADAGDALAQHILARVGTWLGRGLAMLVDVINPELIVIGSIFARCEGWLRPTMEAALREEARSEALAACRIVPARLGEKIGDLAALSIALYESGKL